MAYPDVKSGMVAKGGNGTMTVDAKAQSVGQQAPPVQPVVATAQSPVYVPAQAVQIPPIPVYMDDDEKFVDFRKPGFWSYTPSIFAFAFGFILFILFTIGGQFFGFMLGFGIFLALMLFVRLRLWNRTGYWFTTHKIVIHDGSRTRLVPYDEIALSSLAFENQDCMFSTIYHQEVVLKGIVDMDQVVAFLSRKVKEARIGQHNGNGRTNGHH